MPQGSSLPKGTKGWCLKGGGVEAGTQKLRAGDRPVQEASTPPSWGVGASSRVGTWEALHYSVLHRILGGDALSKGVLPLSRGPPSTEPRGGRPEGCKWVRHPPQEPQAWGRKGKRVLTGIDEDDLGPLWGQKMQGLTLHVVSVTMQPRQARCPDRHGPCPWSRGISEGQVFQPLV